MNDFHMMNLATDLAAERRAEADRARLARTARTQDYARRQVEAAQHPHHRGISLGSLFQRVAFR